MAYFYRKSRACALERSWLPVTSRSPGIGFASARNTRAKRLQAIRFRDDYSRKFTITSSRTRRTARAPIDLLPLS